SKRRSQIDRELKELLNEKTADWGISILSVEIRNILIPAELQDAMSREAQALQEKEARLILAEIEAQIAELMHDASATYKEDDIAFKLRMASMVNETIKESKSGMVVLPSNYSEGFNPEGIEKLLGRE
ncbi:MAG: slipin family protein, partial [Eggerthellaceae bacterium]|nr:slipin family protein [Eggerthellaceae bacterium]